jgi:hypothetical protein
MPIERTASVVFLAVPHKVPKRLTLVSDIFRGCTQVAFDLGQVPLNRCAVHPAA